jgi:hypothetical protein
MWRPEMLAVLGGEVAAGVPAAVKHSGLQLARNFSSAHTGNHGERHRR